MAGVVVAIDKEGCCLVHSKDIDFGHDGGHPYTQDNDHNWWYSESELSLVESFKVGEKVKVVSVSVNDDEYVPELNRYVGSIGTVYDIDDGIVNVEVSDGNEGWFSLKGLEAVNYKEMTNEDLYKQLGYYVKIV